MAYHTKQIRRQCILIQIWPTDIFHVFFFQIRFRVSTGVMTPKRDACLKYSRKSWTYGCDKRPSDAPPFKNGSCDVCISLHWVRDGATRLLLSGECRVRLLSPNRPRLVQTMLASSVTTLSNLSSGWLASRSFHKYSVAYQIVNAFCYLNKY